MALGNQNHFIKLCNRSQFFFGGSMSNDVISHVLIGQTLVGVLLGIALDLASANGKAFVLSFDLLEQCVFIGQGILHHLCESSVYFDYALSVQDRQTTLGIHNNSPSRGRSRPIFDFVYQGCCLVLYGCIISVEFENQSFYWYSFMRQTQVLHAFYGSLRFRGRSSGTKSSFRCSCKVLPELPVLP